MYQEIILDHYRNPHHKGLREPYDVEVHHVNPTCGDEVTLRVKVAHGVVQDVSYDGQGCSISQSSASMMSVAIKGKPIAEVRDLSRQFKAMMSIHESAISDGETAADGAGADPDAPVEVDEQALGDLAALQGVVKFPPRIKCATLAWITLAQGLDDATPA